MSEFLKRILLFVIAFFIFDKIFYIFLLISPALEKDRRLENLINGEINREIIIIGSSRGARNIIAKQIEDSLNLSTYNLSYPGSDIEFHEFLLRTLLKFNEKPKIVILAVDDPNELLPSETINFRFDRLYPLARYSYINEEMIERNEKNFLSRFLVLSRINKKNFDIRRKHFTELDTIKSCGSMPVPFQQKNIGFNYNSHIRNYTISDELPRKVESFLTFQKLCTSNNIKLYLAFPPDFRSFNLSFEERLRQLASPEVSFLIYDTLNEAYKDESLFHDESHLQTSGAVIFTNEIINELKNDQ